MSSTPLLFRFAASAPFTVSLFVGILTFSEVARAQGYDEFGPYGPQAGSSARQSPQHFTLELRMGPYLPNVDSELNGGKEPFKRYFGSKHRVALGLEFDWTPLVIEDILRFGPGGAVMYTTFGGKPVYADAQGGLAPDQTTSLRIFPHWVGGVLRVDALARNTFVPLVFAAKLGFAHALWWTDDVPKDSPAYDGTRGRGRSYGYNYGLGAYLDVGFLDDMARKRLDNFLGINRVYIFGEFYGMELEGFGANGIMHLTNRSWALGLAFDI